MTACCAPLQRAAQSCKTTIQAIGTCAGRKVVEAGKWIAATRIIMFIRENWEKLIAFMIAWAVIISIYGSLYGFERVAWPLAIGVASGFGFGLLSGVLVAVVMDPDKKYSKKNTLWKILNIGLNHLDPNGHRPIVIGTVIPVLLTAASIFPMPVGVAFGAVIGNHIATKIVHGEKLGSEVTLESLKEERNELKARFDEFEARIQTLEERSKQKET